jgi:RHS repeat-associated protein
MTFPIATSPGRAGFGPQLSLSYDSGASNSPFGFGWNLSLPSVTRKTDKGLPQYCDAQDSDVFILSAAEDLVPEFEKKPDGSWLLNGGNQVVHEKPRTVGGVTYTVRRYRPRTEGLFSRIERWTRVDQPGDVHWRSISKDNILTLYGNEPDSRIADPQDSSKIFSWLISETRDDKGNAVLYRYKAEDGRGVDTSRTNEHNRGPLSDSRRSANRYLKHIYYGNRTPLLDVSGKRPPFLLKTEIDDRIAQHDWMFQVVFDYGEHDPATPLPNDAGAWIFRTDPFSSYRAGFEVRTTRLCQRVLMFHHFDGEANVGNDCLVRSTDFTYSAEDESIYTFLAAVTQTGYQRNGGSYDRRSLPPVEYAYSKARIQGTVHDVDAESLENLPIGLDGNLYQWVDLHGEGTPGILTEQAGAWFYKRNLSPASEQLVEFSMLESVVSKPNLSLAVGAQFMDLAGDGQPDLVVMDGNMPGLYEHDEAEDWQPFRTFTSRLNRDMRDPNLKFVDLDGDGHVDVLITENDALVWHASLAEEGFAPARRVAQSLDEEEGPRLVFADGEQSIYLADMSGDGLSDLVRIRHKDVCYWPNLGYARFGAKITMAHAPHFDNPEQFNHKRIRLADIDGSGTTDIIYLHRDGIQIYFNESGNSWSDAQPLNIFPRVDDLTSIMTTDLLGNGTACLVWSSPLPGDARRQMRYVNLMGEQKPHLLIKSTNNLGAETRVQYAPSTRFYLQDKRDGKPWITKLPFPVHVVERVETYDYISRNRFVTRYAYHHGYFDGKEREFRGFGMVEQWDTEQLAALLNSDVFPAGTNVDAASHMPPVYTKTWFHTGVYLGREHVSGFFAGLLNANDKGEYYREPGLSDAEARTLLLPDTLLPVGLSLDEEREACRALKGMMLRQEIYAIDGTAKQEHPYTVTEQNFTIEFLQPREKNRHGIFFAHPRESLSFHYERNPADPRIQHALTLEVDAFGNVKKSAAIAYGRRMDSADAALQPADREKQRLIHITCSENEVTNAIVNLPDTYHVPLPAQTCSYEIRKAQQEKSSNGLTNLYRFEEVAACVSQAGDGTHDIPYEDLELAAAQQKVANDATESTRYFRRLIEQTRTLYRKDDLTGLLPLGQLESLALAGEHYKLSFTPGLLAQIFQRPLAGNTSENLLPPPAAVLAGQGEKDGGYLQSQVLKTDGRFPNSDPDDYWWIPSGRAFCSTNPSDTAASELAEARQHFFLTRRYRDPFGQDTVVNYNYDLLVAETRDVLGNRVAVEISDYRVLQPRLVSDQNRNQTAVLFDTLGMVAGTALMGKPLPATVEGDALSGLVADLTQAQIDQFYNAADPHGEAQNLLQNATSRIVYDLDRFRRTRNANPADSSKWLPPYAATLARETHVSATLPPQGLRIQIIFSYSDGLGREIQKKIQAEPESVNGVAGALRWVGSGWTIYNNKGKPVRQYEPFFSQLPAAQRHHFEFGVTAGVSPVLFYDPAERVVCTLHPNNTYQKVVFDPWQQTTYDVNDTVAARNAQTGDPRSDPDIQGYVAGYFNALPAQPWQTWHQQRINGNKGPHEQAAAQKAAAHADTPATAHFDALGRAFLTVARNRVACANHKLDGTEEQFSTRMELDIEGNQRAVRDASTKAQNAQGTEVEDKLGRIVMLYAYDMLGNRVYQHSMESSTRWMLNDAAGKPIRTWDSRGHNFVTAYDQLRRQIKQYVIGTTNDSDSRTRQAIPLLVDNVEYGEAQPNAEALNLRTRTFRHCDTAGITTHARLDANGKPVAAYDFKGNLLHNTRQLVTDYKGIPDWSANPALENETFVSSTRYDALNRAIQSVAPHSSHTGVKCNVIQPVFNESNLLDRLDVWLERSAEPAGLLNPATEAPSAAGISNIDYDAKGQRKYIEYKNGAATRYTYDEETFKLIQLYTRRDSTFTQDCDNAQPPTATIAAPELPPAGVYCGLQNLHYNYDPAGNITHIQDDAQQTIYFNNQRVEPSNDYTYDALYRLIEGTGREHLGQGGEAIPHTYNDALRSRLQHPNSSAMGTYAERYVYDAAGNFVEMKHDRTNAQSPGWTRSYTCDETSLIENGSGGTLRKASNRLSRTTLNPGGNNPVVESYQHDAHGNMLTMPQLQMMQWDYKDQLRTSQRQKINSEDLEGVAHDGDRTYYVYDTGGERARKVTELAGGNIIEERIYLAGFEIFRRHAGAIGANTATLERETLHVMDDKQRIALVEMRTLGTDPSPAQLIRYQLGNQPGSASLELDQAAQIISYEEYTPFGSTSYQAVRSQTETPKRYRYSGKERDEENGLYYHGARYYAAWLGRWSSTDPIGLLGGGNLYEYCRNSPVMYHDPQGTDEEKKDPASSKLPAGTAAVGLLGQVANILGKPAGFTAMGQGLREAKLMLNIDEIMAVSRGGSWSNPGNKQFLDWLTNQFTKNAGIASHNIPARPQISLAEELAKGAKQFREAASQLMTRRFSEVKELEKITNDAVAALKNTKRSARDLANAVNKSIRGRIARAASDDAKIVARALREAGFDPKTLTALKQETSAVGAAVPTAAKGGKVAGFLAKAAPVLGRIARAVAPAAKVLGRVATPVAALGVGVQFATAKTSEDYANASVSAASTALMAAPHPVAKAAGAGLAVGQILDQSLNVSDHSSKAGVYVYEKLKGAGLNDTASFVVGGVVSVIAIPSAIGYGAAAKVASWFQ